MDDELIYAVVFVTMLFLFLLAVIVTFFYISARNKARQDAEFSFANLLFEKELRMVEYEVSEALLTHMSTELHDNIGQLLTAMTIQITNLKLSQGNRKAEIDSIESTLTVARSQLKSLSRTLNSDYITRNGLQITLDLEIQRLKLLRKFDIMYENNNPSIFLNLDEQLIVFRVFQEISQNALKHSLAKTFKVSLVCTKTDFLMEIVDDGIGFDLPNILDSPRAFGLQNIMKRCKLANISFEIITQKTCGCKITISKSIETLSKTL